jgi:hypothetical protein
MPARGETSSIGPNDGRMRPDAGGSAGQGHVSNLVATMRLALGCSCEPQASDRLSARVQPSMNQSSFRRIVIDHNRNPVNVCQLHLRDPNLSDCQRHGEMTLDRTSNDASSQQARGGQRSSTS